MISQFKVLKHSGILDGTKVDSFREAMKRLFL